MFNFSNNPEIIRKIEEYGLGFDEIYKNGLADGRSVGFADGVDVEIVSCNTGISVDELKKFR